MTRNLNGFLDDMVYVTDLEIDKLHKKTMNIKLMIRY